MPLGLPLSGAWLVLFGGRWSWVWVCVGEGEIPRMGSPWAWGNIGECVGVTCGLQRKGKRPANSALLLFEEGEEEEEDY